MKIIDTNTEPASVDVECILPNKQLASPQPVVQLFCLTQTIALNQSFQKITKKANYKQYTCCPVSLSLWKHFLSSHSFVVRSYLRIARLSLQLPLAVRLVGRPASVTSPIISTI